LIYFDTSVVIAHLLAEERMPPEAIWRESLVSSRLLVYEAWSRLNRRRLGGSHGALLERVLERIAFLDLRDEVLARALEPFPAPVRTLDALHLSSLAFLASRGIRAELLSYDDRMIAGARAMDLAVADL
jgi:predicted nucleic acid-binding protein